MTEEQPAQPKLVRDLMTVGVLTCSPTTSIKVISQALLEKDLEAVVVLDHDGHAVGIVGRDELVKAFNNPDHNQLIAEDIMNLTAFIYVGESMPNAVIYQPYQYAEYLKNHHL